MYIVEWASALRRGGLATQMLREARKGWGRGRGRTELQVHLSNRRGLRYYRGLGMRRCRWWRRVERGGTQDRRELIGDSLYEPRPGYQMMQVEAGDLERELRAREGRHAPIVGVEYICVKGVRGLREAGVLEGVRAMMARIYGGEEWYVNDDGGTGRVECLYERDSRGGHEVTFIVAKLTGDDEWARNGRGRNDGGGRGRADDTSGDEIGGDVEAERVRGAEEGGKSGTRGGERGGGRDWLAGEKRRERYEERGEGGRGRGGKERKGVKEGTGRKRRREEDAAGGDRPVRTCGVG